MSAENKIRIRELVEHLNKAREAYYKDGGEIISNFEYDKLYDELVELEEKTGIVLADSPSINVGYETLDSLPKQAHEKPMLSLDKTKDIEELKLWLGEKKGLLSCKLDGLTVVLRYQNGRLVNAVTRGNGEIGEVITSNAKTFKNLPLVIPFKGEVIIRGEAFIKYSDFEKINREIPELDAKYKNPRNLCSGSVRQLNNEITAQRNVNFAAFALDIIRDENGDVDLKNSHEEGMKWLEGQGFEIVQFKNVNRDNLEHEVRAFSNEVGTMDIPSDGLVLIFNDIEYGKRLGNTSKFPRNAIAFKWEDEIAETRLISIEWSPSRTGLINPIAIFEPVQLEGTTVSRASVHNVSILKDLKLGIGDYINVYKANMIIPQIAENLTKSGTVLIPEECPVCAGKTVLKREIGVETLLCTNPNCPAKKIKAFALFVSRNAMNIENLSEATLEKFIGEGIIKEFSDIFHLRKWKEKIENMEGFGEKSYKNLIEAIDKSRNSTLSRLLYALGIPGIGVSNAKLIAKEVKNRWDRVAKLTFDQLIAIDGIGEIMANSFLDYFGNEENKNALAKLIAELNLDEGETEVSDGLDGKIFVITGSLKHYENRDALKEEIENRGGKVVGTISSKTTYLINNDVESTSSKNKKANALNIPVISEEDFINLIREV